MIISSASLDILGSDGKNINLVLDDTEILNHFLNPTSHIECIVDKQINTDKIYDFYFKDKKDLVVIDAGANVGMFSVHCSPSSKIIYAIEPTPSHFSILKKITSKFKNIIPINCALWNKDENLTFYIIPSNTTSNTIVNYGGQPMTVIGKTLQTIINNLSMDHELAMAIERQVDYLQEISSHLDKISDKLGDISSQLDSLTGYGMDTIGDVKKTLEDIDSSIEQINLQQ